MKRLKRPLLFALVVLLAAGGCTPVGPNYEGPPGIRPGETFTGASGRQPAGELDGWWRRLGNRQLNALVEDVLEHNYDHAIAVERFREARSMRKAAASAFLPHATGNLSWTRIDFGGGGGGITGEITKTGVIKDPLEFWSAGADVSWELDVFGGRRRESAAAEATAEAALESVYAVRLALVAETTEAFCTLAGLREQHAEVTRQIKLQEAQLADLQEREAAGAASRLDLDRARVPLETARALLPPLEAGITAQLRRLALLLGSPPYSLDAHRLAETPLPRKLPIVRAGLPAELVMRRPDLRRAERELAAATEDIGVAAAEFYPKFSLLGSPAASTSQVGDLFKPASFDLQVGPQVSWSLFSGGRNRALLDAAESRQKQALYRYQQAVLAAVGEVETELANLRADQQRLAVVLRARDAAATAARRVREAYDAGALDYADVLREEQQLREAEIAVIRVKSELLLVWTRFHKALGGGWQ